MENRNYPKMSLMLISVSVIFSKIIFRILSLRFSDQTDTVMHLIATFLHRRLFDRWTKLLQNTLLNISSISPMFTSRERSCRISQKQRICRWYGALAADKMSARNMELKSIKFTGSKTIITLVKLFNCLFINLSFRNLFAHIHNESFRSTRYLDSDALWRRKDSGIM